MTNHIRKINNHLRELKCYIKPYYSKHTKTQNIFLNFPDTFHLENLFGFVEYIGSEFIKNLFSSLMKVECKYFFKLYFKHKSYSVVLLQQHKSFFGLRIKTFSRQHGK